MEWYEKVVLYTALGFTMIKFWDVISYFKDEINGEEELLE